MAAIIVAAGRGERAGSSGGPKQYRPLAGQTVLARTLTPFLGENSVDLVLAVIHPDDSDLYGQSAAANRKLLPPVTGGATRQESVLRGLQALEPHVPDIVLIHDAARPFASSELIRRVIEGASRHGAALPVVALADTLKRGGLDGKVLETVARDGLYRAQTPQGFEFSKIFDAHRSAAQQDHLSFTDDAAIAEWAGISVTMVDGETGNTKLTTAGDIARAEAGLTGGRGVFADIRTGIGYDTHQLVPGNSLRLCGVDIPHSASLKGHSDADAGLHALTDALLGTIASGDIGSHFPPSDPQWKGASSERFLRHAVDLVRDEGGQINHLDITLICEHPKIGPHRDRMRAEIARMADLAVNRISVKATTNERIGFIGREEGIAAIATATVWFGEQP